MKLFALVAIIGACTAGIIPRSLTTDDHKDAASEPGISKFKAPNISVKTTRVKWVDWKRLLSVSNRKEQYDEKFQSESTHRKPQSDEFQIHMKKGEDGLLPKQLNTSANLNEAQEVFETRFQDKIQSIETPDNLIKGPDINMPSSEIGNLSNVEKVSVSVVTDAKNVSSPFVEDITEDLNVTKLTGNSTDLNQTRDKFGGEFEDNQIFRSNVLESEQTDKPDSEMALNTLDVNSLDSKPTSLTHLQERSELIDVFKNKTSNFATNTLDFEIAGGNDLKQTTAIEKIGRHNASQGFNVDSTEIETKIDGVEATETNITDTKTTLVIKPVSTLNNSSNKSVEFSVITKFPDSKETPLLENIDSSHNASQIFNEDTGESSVRITDSKFPVSENIDIINDSPKIIDVESPETFKQVDAEETAVFKHIGDANDSLNILDVNVTKLLKRLNSTGHEAMSVLELIRSGATNASAILDLFTFTELVTFEVVTENISSVESFSVDETELMNEGSEIAMFQEVSTNGFEFLLDSDTAKNMILTEMLNSQSFSENDLGKFIVEEEVSASSGEIAELDFEGGEIGFQTTKEIGKNVSSSAQKFNLSTDFNISELENSQISEVNAGTSDGASTGGRISDAPTTSLPKECPRQGLCLFWFFTQDDCTDNSQCLEFQLCCKIGCSKICIEV